MGVAFVCLLLCKDSCEAENHFSCDDGAQVHTRNALKLRNSSINKFVPDLRCLKLNVQFPDVSQKALSSRVHMLPQDIPLVCRGTQLF